MLYGFNLSLVEYDHGGGRRILFFYFIFFESFDGIHRLTRAYLDEYCRLVYEVQ